MKLSKREQIEYDRLESGPQKGWFTFLHHDGPVIEKTNNLMERISYIVENKSPSERLVRLRHIRSVPPEMVEIYHQTFTRAKKIYEKIVVPAWKRYENSIIFAERNDDSVAPAWEIYQAVAAPARKILDEAVAPIIKSILALIPDCSWDGKTIIHN